MNASDAVVWALAVLLWCIALGAVLFTVALVHDLIAERLPRRERK